MYFFHNIYGEEYELLQSIPESVTPVPFGWGPEEEFYRDQVLDEIGVNVSELPSIAVFIDEHYADKSFFQNIIELPPDDPREQVDLHFVPAQWTVFPLKNIEKPWSWESIFSTINNYHKL